MFARKYEIGNFLHINYAVTTLWHFNMMPKLTTKLCKEKNVDPQ